MSTRLVHHYLDGYPVALVEQVFLLIDQDQLGRYLRQKYPAAHDVRADNALYDFALEIKNTHLRNCGRLNKVVYDNKLQVLKRALGTHTQLSQVQGENLQTKREIRIAIVFKEMPLEFLRMIVVHELAHMKVRDHSKAFYQLCRKMEPEYAQFEFDLRAYLTYLKTGKEALWPTRTTPINFPAPEL